MANVFKCDVCGKETKVAPKFEKVFEEIEGKQVPKMTTIKTMNFATGETVEQVVQETRDLEERCYIVKLNAGPQVIQRDFCEEHYKEILPHINQLWKALEEVGSK